MRKLRRAVAALTLAAAAAVTPLAAPAAHAASQWKEVRVPWNGSVTARHSGCTATIELYRFQLITVIISGIVIRPNTGPYSDCGEITGSIMSWNQYGELMYIPIKPNGQGGFAGAGVNIRLESALTSFRNAQGVARAGFSITPA